VNVFLYICQGYGPYPIDILLKVEGWFMIDTLIIIIIVLWNLLNMNDIVMPVYAFSMKFFSSLPVSTRARKLSTNQNTQSSTIRLSCPEMLKCWFYTMIIVFLVDPWNVLNIFYQCSIKGQLSLCSYTQTHNRIHAPENRSQFYSHLDRSGSKLITSHENI